MSEPLDALLSAATEYGDRRANTARSEMQPQIDAALSRAINAEDANVALRIEFDAYRAAHPETPPPEPAPNYGGTTGWGPAKRIDLTSEPVGTSYTSGVRASTDQSNNRKQNATYGKGGLTVKAERVGGVIYSADVLMRGVDIPDVAAIEVDIDMQGTGPGMGHAFWLRPIKGDGEVDVLEYIGSNAAKSIVGGAGKYESKATLIRTGPPKTYNLGSKAFGIPPREDGTYNGLRRYRAELTKDSYSLWVDGALAGTITKDAFEKQNGAGSWAQFASGTHWYPRVTLQVGNGTSAKLWGAAPAVVNASITVSALRVFARS